MKMRPNSIAVLVYGISLLLASTTAKAGDSFFSINFGYSSHGHYASPYRYIYSPAYYYSIPSPFFFGYTSYYYPVFPYYYTPVVYYRPVFPYYNPYAYQPYWYTYRVIYPYSYIYGYYPYNSYYSYYPLKYYKYQHDHHYDHFYGHGNKQQYAGSYKKYSPGNKRDVLQRSGNRDIKTATVIETNNTQQRSVELVKQRTLLQQRPVNQRTGRPAVRPSRSEQQTLAATDPRSVLQRRQNRQDMERGNIRNQRTEQSSQSERNANNARIDRLINRDRKPSPTEMESSNRPIQQRQAINQHSDRRAQTRVTTINKRVIAPPTQARQTYQQQPVRRNLDSPGNGSFRQPPAVTVRSNQNIQRQVARQQPVRSNIERPGNRSSFRQEQIVSARNQQDGQQARPVAREREPSTEKTISMRVGERRSLNQNYGYGMQQRQMSQRSFAGAGKRR